MLSAIGWNIAPYFNAIKSYCGSPLGNVVSYKCHTDFFIESNVDVG